MKLTKEKLNELLYYLQIDDFENALIFKLQYVYGRNAREVLELRVSDIDLTYETITFTTKETPITYPFDKSVSEDLISIIYEDGLKKDNKIFKYNNDFKIAIATLNTYLHDAIIKINKFHNTEFPKLTTKDFRNLRGQHLFLDGAGIETIHEFYHNSNINSTRLNINYGELKKYKQNTCNSVDDIFKELTDTNLYYDDHFDDFKLITVSDCQEDILIELDYQNNSINILDGEETNLSKRITQIDSDTLFDELRRLKKNGQYKLINGMRFLKN